MLRRRTLLTLLAAGIAPQGHGHATERRNVPLRVACMDWMAAETLLLLGVAPAGVIDVEGYARTVAEPRLPASVVDLGAGWAPNIEVLQRIAPDLVLLPQWPVQMGPIERIASTAALPSNVAGLDRIDTAKNLLPDLAQRVGAAVSAKDVIRTFEAEIAAARQRLATFPARPVCYVVLNPNGRHVTIAARGSLMDDVFRRLGLANAWTGDAPDWGLVQTGVEHLAVLRDAHLIHADEGARTAVALRALSRSRIWNGLPAVAAGRISAVPPIYFYGGLATAGRFARQIAESLSHAGR